MTERFLTTSVKNTRGVTLDKNIITISIEDVTVDAELDMNATAAKVLEAMPFESKANWWGDEIYFTIPVTLEQAPDAREKVEIGDLAYWPTGQAFCIFFGPTPVSTDENPRAYSPVNVFGRIRGDASVFKGTSTGATVRVVRKHR